MSITFNLTNKALGFERCFIASVTMRGFVDSVDAPTYRHQQSQGNG